MWSFLLVPLLATVASYDNYSFVMPVPYCTIPSNLMYIDLTKRLLENLHYLTVIETSDGQNPTVTALQCTLDGLKQPLTLYTLKEFQRQIARKKGSNARMDINPYSEVEGFLSRGTFETFMQSIIPSVAQLNPLARTILAGYDLTRQQIINLFQLAWYQYREPNLFIINRANDATVEVCLLNPFITPEGSIVERNVNCKSIRSLEEVAPYIEYSEQFLHERVNHLNGYPLNIAIADVDLMSRAVRDRGGKITHFTYLDGEIVEIMRKMINFTVNFVILESQLSTGFVYPNGSLGGSLILIERGHIDLAANSRIIDSYKTKNLQYLRQLTTTKLIFIVPKNYYESRSKNQVFFNLFTWSFYSINIVIAVAIPLLLKLIADGSVETSTSAAIMHALAVTLAVSTKLPTRIHERMIFSGILLYALVSYSIWQAIIIKRLNSNNDYLDDIQDLDELLKSKLVPRIPVAYAQFTHPNQKEYYALDNLHWKLSRKATVAKNNDTGATLIAEMLARRSSAVLIHDLRANVVLARFYDDEHRQSLIHAVSEYVFEFYTAMALPKNSPFLEPFNEVTVRCVESGIVAYQLARIEFKGVLYMIANNRDNHRPGVDAGSKRFDMGVWKNVFYIYLGLNCAALVIFLMEIIIHNRIVHRHKTLQSYQ